MASLAGEPGLQGAPAQPLLRMGLVAPEHVGFLEGGFLTTEPPGKP